MVPISLNTTQIDIDFPELDKDFPPLVLDLPSTPTLGSHIDGVIVEKPFVDPYSEFRENEIRQEGLKRGIATEIEEVMKNSKNHPSSKVFFIQLSSKPIIKGIREKYSHIWHQIYENWGDTHLMNIYIDSLRMQDRDKTRQGFEKDFYLLLGVIHDFHASITKNSPC